MYKPIEIKRSTKYGNNYWETYSSKLGRNVRFFSDLEYDNWVHLECNPKVISFCEQPLKIRTYINGKFKESILDMWVLYDDNTEEFQEIKYANELEGNSLKSIRSLAQIEAQRKWCEENGYNHVVRTDKEIRYNLTHLNNLKQIISQVKNCNDVNELDIECLLNLFDNSSSELLIKDIKNTTSFDLFYTIKLVCYLVYKGKIRIINLSEEINMNTKVGLVYEEKGF